jgi:hypothetical protein
MTGKELIVHLRESVLDDNKIPYLWEDPELIRFLNYAEVQACRRAHLIVDATTASDSGTAATASTAGQRPLCVLPIIANQAVYELSRKILQVKRVQFQSMPYEIPGSPVRYPELDESIPDWFGTAGTVSTAGSGGYPDCYLNEPGNTITFVRAPSANDTASLIVVRIPLVSFDCQTSPEIEEKYHIDLCDWAAHLAFMKPDSDTNNANLAKFYEDRFEKKFGPLPDAYSVRMRKVLAQRTRMRAREFGS